MKIFIIGAGVVGKPWAVSLHRAGKEVELIRGHLDEGTSQKEKITLEFKDGPTFQAQIGNASLTKRKMELNRYFSVSYG